MPKYGIHHIVLDEAVHRLKAGARSPARDAGYALEQHRDAAMLGAIGPDLFFWAPDYEAINTLYPLYKNLKGIMSVYDRVQAGIDRLHDLRLKPVTQPVGDLLPHSHAVIETILREMKETAELLKSTISTSLFAGVAALDGLRLPDDLGTMPSASAVLFQSFAPRLQNNEPEDRWYWFDMLHYRNTGDFARQLVTSARTGSQRAYAYGYLSHIATDLVGHSYVNQIVGGPYRLHVQRHVTVENFMDASAFWQTYGLSINHALCDRLGLPKKPLPSEIGDLLHQALQATYDPSSRPVQPPPFLSRDQIDGTYEVFFDVLQMICSMTMPPPQEPFTGVAAVLANAIGDLLEPAPAPPSSASPGGACSWEEVLAFGTTPSSRACYESFFRQAARWLEHLGEVLKWAFETLLDLIDALIALALSLPAVVVEGILYGIQIALYEIYSTVRSVLVLQGFVSPEPDDLRTSHGRNLVTTFQCCPAAFDEYPRWTDLGVSHLVCPPQVLEYPTTAASFSPSSAGVTPERFMRQTLFQPAHLRAYAGASSPLETRNLQAQQVNIGNATDLTAWLVATAHDPGASAADQDLAYTNWNLDADRGYGYKAWQGTVPSSGGQQVLHEGWA